MKYLLLFAGVMIFCIGCQECKNYHREDRLIIPPKWLTPSYEVSGFVCDDKEQPETTSADNHRIKYLECQETVNEKLIAKRNAELCIYNMKYHPDCENLVKNYDPFFVPFSIDCNKEPLTFKNFSVTVDDSKVYKELK